MSPDEIEVALQVAFHHCDTASCPLTDIQKEILLQVVEQIKANQSHSMDIFPEEMNPLVELTPGELSAFLNFVREQEEISSDWKVQLLNDWVHGVDSGNVQFIRDRYGLQWLNRIQPHHWQEYITKDTFNLKVGDRIQVCNALWEWVQANSPCEPEWFPCVVLHMEQVDNGDNSFINCIVRFPNGTEYEIQGIDDWNRYHWRWLEE